MARQRVPVSIRSRYPSSLSLERIVLENLGYRGEVSNRQDLFSRLIETPVVIIIDELSEFLRSKPSAPQFYEDIRFLQFLGEFSFNHPLWIVASLQEWIEETGHISSGIFNRIKDRYPLRVNLTSSHIEDIIDQRLMIKKEGAGEVIKGVFENLRAFYPHLALKYEHFRKTYPLHPLTTRYLTGLTPVFSQHRGVIQFIVTEVKKRLKDPADHLITPDIIFDHFEERIREIPEYSPLVRIAYDYYRNQIDALFEQDLQRDTAFAVIKILILTEITPLEKRKTAREIAEMLLKKVSTISQNINYDYIKNAILEPLASHQMYINKEEDTYYVDIAVEEGIRIRGRIKAIREKFADRAYLFSEICNLISIPHLPLRDLKDGKRYRFQWQQSQRECLVQLRMTDITGDDIERLINGIKRHVDGYLLFLSPFVSPEGLSGLRDAFDSPYLPAIAFWIPRQWTEEEMAFIEEYVAKNLLLRDIPNLKEELRRDEPLFRDTVTSLYFDGRVLYGSGNEIRNMKDIGYLPMERLLNHLFDYSLSEIHPDHQKVMPMIDFCPARQISSLYTSFIRQGRITIEEAEKRGLTQYIKGMLEPLSLVRKKGTVYAIDLNVDNELISHILNMISHEHNADEIRMRLKKGRWGLSDDQTDILLASLIAAGYIMPYSKSEAIELRELSQLSSGEITRLKHGKTLDPDLLSFISRGGFIWGDVESAPTPATQKLMWKEASQFIKKYRKVLDELNSLMEKYRDYSVFKHLKIDLALINRLTLFVHSMALNASPAEGIERFLFYLKENPDMDGQIACVEGLHRFLTEDFQLLNKYYLYLTHPAFHAMECLPQSGGSAEIVGDIVRKREKILNRIKEFSSTLTGFDDLRDAYEEFHDSFVRAYKEAHEDYYNARIFKMRRETEEEGGVRALKRISHIVSSITFKNEWWEIKRELDALPDACRFDLNHNLFLNPICACGFSIGMEPTGTDRDFESLSNEGIRNFLITLQSPENREKLESSVTALNAAGKKDIALKLLSLLNLKPEKISAAMLIPLLSDDLLSEIENAFKGRWKIREVSPEKLLKEIRGRRFRHRDLREILNRWIGSEEEGDTIIHVLSDDSGRERGGEDLLQEELARYGAEGERIYLEIMDKGISAMDSLESALMEEGNLHILEDIHLNHCDIRELVNLLDGERLPTLRKRLRSETTMRVIDGPLSEDLPTKDEWMTDIIMILKNIRNSGRHRGIEVFTKTIAPSTLLLKRLIHNNINERLLSNGQLKKIEEGLHTLTRDYEREERRFEGARDLRYVRERLSGTAVVLDGLRYDLWCMLKDVMTAAGWKITDEPVVAGWGGLPTTTGSFREAIGIRDEGSWESNTGFIDGKSCAMMKGVEKDIGKRNLRRFLKGDADIKILHFNFIDTKIHNSTIDLYPLYSNITEEFRTGILPLFKELGRFYLLSDHGFIDTGNLKERYRHGGNSIWESILPFAEVR